MGFKQNLAVFGKPSHDETDGIREERQMAGTRLNVGRNT